MTIGVQFKETIRTVIVFAIVITCVLIFFKGLVRLWTLGAFVVGLAPFVISAFWRDKHRHTKCHAASGSGDELLDYDHTEQDIWVWGINNSDCSYRKE